MISSLRHILTFLALSLSPFVASAQGTTFRDFVAKIVDIMNLVVGILVVAGVVVYFYGITRHMMKTEQTESKEMRYFLVMGVIALFVMVSIWGILELMRNTILSDPDTIPDVTSTYPAPSDVFFSSGAFE